MTLRSPDEPGTLLYKCNICGSSCRTPMAEMHRENPTCNGCGSTPRNRSVITLLTRGLLGTSRCLEEVAPAKHIVGIGMSDSEPMAHSLSGRFRYTNTFFHQEPYLDITRPPHALLRSCDFLIASEVFEHVAPPISVAFQNARNLLKPTGFLVLTVPYATGAGVATKEHFPRLHKYEMHKNADGGVRLINTTQSGATEVFDDLVFHGGPGVALEMRLFSEEGLIGELEAAGFESVVVMRDSDFEHGVFWPQPWSRPVLARLRALSA